VAILHIRPVVSLLEALSFFVSVSQKGTANGTAKGWIKSTIMQGDGPQTMDGADGRHFSFFSLSTVSTSGYYFQVLLDSYFLLREFLILKDKVTEGSCLCKGMAVINTILQHFVAPWRSDFLFQPPSA
jgi:hypothetical protein